MMGTANGLEASAPSLSPLSVVDVVRYQQVTAEQILTKSVDVQIAITEAYQDKLNNSSLPNRFKAVLAPLIALANRLDRAQQQQQNNQSTPYADALRTMIENGSLEETYNLVRFPNSAEENPSPQPGWRNKFDLNQFLNIATDCPPQLQTALAVLNHFKIPFDRTVSGAEGSARPNALLTRVKDALSQTIETEKSTQNNENNLMIALVAAIATRNYRQWLSGVQEQYKTLAISPNLEPQQLMENKARQAFLLAALEDNADWIIRLALEKHPLFQPDSETLAKMEESERSEYTLRYQLAAKDVLVAFVSLYIYYQGTQPNFLFDNTKISQYADFLKAGQLPELLDQLVNFMQQESQKEKGRKYSLEMLEEIAVKFSAFFMLVRTMPH